MIHKDVILFLALILLVVVSNIMAIVLVPVMEHTSMISLLKALVASDRLIKYITLWNNLHLLLNLLLKGMLWGNKMGLGLEAFKSYIYFILQDLTYYYISYIPIAWNGWIILLLNGGVFLLISLVLLISIMFLARLRPVKANQSQ